MATRKGKRTTDAPSKADLKEFRKTNEAIGLRVSEGRLSLLSRKIFNVMVYHAQRLPGKGGNAPIDTDAAKNYYWIPLAEVARDAAYDSKDVDLLKECALELQNIRIHSEDAIQWTSERLVSSVKLVNTSGLKRQGGTLWFGFAFPPEVESMVMSPGSYTKLSVYYQALLRSGASLALYEICRRYATNPSRLTNRQEWEWWYGALTGNPVTGSLPEYKYFKRDTIKTAIAEINMVTDISVELIEHKTGRRVTALQFKVTPNETSISLPPVIDGGMVNRMMALGMSQDDACNLLATTEEAKLAATLDLTEKRIANPKAPKIESPVAFFKTALRDNYAAPVEVARKTVLQVEARPKPDVKASIGRVRDQYLAARAQDALGLYQELGEDEQAAWLERFKDSDAAKGINIARGLTAPTARNAFSYWFAAQQWSDPTDSDLLAFAAQRQDRAAGGAAN